MSHFAKVLDGKVVQVIVAEQDFIDSFVDSSPGEWIQTSYNTLAGKHLAGGKALRGNFAGIGYTYDKTLDVFIPPTPFPSWALNKKTFSWDAPVAMPTDGKAYNWDEANQNWAVAV